MLANRARLVLESVSIGPGDHVVTLCQNKLCVRPEHHVLGTDSDARQLAFRGSICPAYQMIGRQQFDVGAIDVDDLALCFAVSRHVAEAIVAEGQIRQADS